MPELSISALADTLRHQADRIAKLVIAQDARIELLERQVLAAHDTITDLRRQLAEASRILSATKPSELRWNDDTPTDAVIDNGGDAGATGRFLKMHADMEKNG